MLKKTTGQNLPATESVLGWTVLTTFTSEMDRPLSLSITVTTTTQSILSGKFVLRLGFLYLKK